MYKSVTHYGSFKILCMLADRPARFTEIMFKSELSPSVLNKLLKDLISLNILAKDGSKYYLTEKGEKILELLLQLYNSI